MIENLASLSTLTTEILWHGFLVFIRVSAAVSLMPGFGERSVSVRVKLAIALAFSAIVAPMINSGPPTTNLTQFFPLLLTETLSGFLIGIGIRLFTMALQTAGAIAAQSTSLSQLLGGAVAEPLAAIGYILTMGAIALSMIAGLHVKATTAIILSYDILPIGMLVTGPQIAEWGVQKTTSAFQLAFVLAAPFILVSVLYNLALGAINKAMPQLMVAFVGAPLITFGGIFLLFISTPFLLSTWINALDAFLVMPFGDIQ